MKILLGFMVSEIQKVVLWGASIEDLELVASSLNPGGFQTEGHSGDLESFEERMRSRSDVAAVVLVWSGEIRDALASRLFARGAPVAVIDHVYRPDAAQDLFSLGAALYIGKRQLGLLPAALARVIAEHRSGAAFGPGSAKPKSDQISLTVLHDLANILTGIQGKLRLLNEHAAPSLQGEMVLLEETCRSAVDLVRQSLFLSSPADESPSCEAAMTLRQIGSLFRALLPPAVIFEEHLPADGLGFKLARPQVIQVALNLLLNARDAVLERAAEAEPSAAFVPYVQLGCSIAGAVGDAVSECLVLHVRDNGSGMAPEVLQKVFEPGFTTKPAGRGSGLGLLSVREALRECGGWIDVNSRPGMGTEFLAHIPCVRSTAAHHAHGWDKTVGENSGTVLVVEDDALLAVVLRELFEELGFQLLLAQDSVSALQLMKESKSPVSLVVSDFSMPGLSGLDLKSLVNTFSPETKFILCSGYGLPDSSAVSESLHFLRKPYHTEELIAKVREVLAEEPETK